MGVLVTARPNVVLVRNMDWNAPVCVKDVKAPVAEIHQFVMKWKAPKKKEITPIITNS